MTTDYEARARALVGTRFRPQGRGSGGLDCLGLVLAVYDLPTNCVRRNYRLRGDHIEEVRAGLASHFRSIGRDGAGAGDLMLLRPGAGHVHFAVLTGRGFVHADAGIGRVVETPGQPGWPALGTYRKRVRSR